MSAVDDSELHRIRQKVEAGERLTDAELERLRAAAQFQPGPTLRLAVAHALINNGDERSARVLLERLVRDFPRELQCWLGLARAELLMERVPEGERALKEALALSPKDPEALKVLAMLAMRRSEIARARQLVADVLRADPFDAEARLLKEELEAAELPPASPPASPTTAVALRPEFIRSLLQALRGRGLEAGYKGDALLLRPEGGEWVKVNLGSLYAGYLAQTEPLEEAVRGIADRLLAASMGMPGSADALLEHVLPVLRPAAFADVARGAAFREGPAGLCVFYVIEDPELVRYVPAGSLAARGIELEALDAAAFARLEARAVPLRPVQIVQGRLIGGDRGAKVQAICEEDGHDAARLLCASERVEIARALGEGPWRVDLGRREATLVCREADGDAVAQLESMPVEPDGIAGRFRLSAQGHLERIP